MRWLDRLPIGHARPVFTDDAGFGHGAGDALLAAHRYSSALARPMAVVASLIG